MEIARTDPIRLRLYIAGMAVRSQTALHQLRLVCQAYPEGRVQLEIVDVFQNPELAQRDQVLAIPTLVWLSPPPTRRLIGDLTNLPRVKEFFGAMTLP